MISLLDAGKLTLSVMSFFLSRKEKKGEKKSTIQIVTLILFLTGRLAHLNCNILWEKKNNDTAKKLDKPTTTRKKRDIYVIF